MRKHTRTAKLVGVAVIAAVFQGIIIGQNHGWLAQAMLIAWVLVSVIAIDLKDRRDAELAEYVYDREDEDDDTG